MKIGNILKGVICSLLISAASVKAEFEQECLEVKGLTTQCKVDSQGKISEV